MEEKMRRRLTRRAWLRLVAFGALAATIPAMGCAPPRDEITPTPPGSSPTVAPSSTAVPTERSASAVTVTPTPSGAPRQPNVLLVTIDTLRPDRLGTYGLARASTPFFDRLAAEGARFDRAICQLPQTNASHAALMTGLYPSTNGVKVHMVDRLRQGAQTLAGVFGAAGYRTAGIYSWVSLDPQFCGLNQGFQTYEGYVLNRSAIFSDPRLEELSAFYRRLKERLPVLKTADAVLNTSGSIEESLDGRADVTNEAVSRYLDAHPDEEPFFLWVHYFDPHYPYAPPSGYDHIFGLDYRGSVDGSLDTIHQLQQGELDLTPDDHARVLELYQGEIAFVDTQFGRLLDQLRARNLLDDTIIAVTGDHGESFGEHGDWTHGWKVYDSEVRVPLLMRYPRQIPAGTVIGAPVQVIDIMPTLLELSGLQARQSVQGASMVPLLNGQVTGADRVAFTELADETFVSLLVMQEWKLIRNNASGELQLYHLAHDVDEQLNLVQDQPQITRELNARLTDMMKFSGVTR